MPTLLRVGPYRFSIVMADCIERAHVHVSGGNGACKLWLSPISIARSAGYGPREQRAIMQAAEAHQQLLVQRWDEECGQPE
jgi:hypothetical protein